LEVFLADNRIGIKGRTVDLFVKFIDTAGNPTIADDIPQVKITDSNGTVQQQFTNLGVSLIEPDSGTYKLTYTIPLNTADGYAMDTWRAEIGGEQIQNTFAFLVMASGDIAQDSEPTYTPGDEVPYNFTKEEVYGINVLLNFLKKRLKNDGVSKVPDGMGGYMAQQCNVFSDAELIAFLVNGLSEFNQIPHFTAFTFADQVIYTIFSDVVVQGAVILALAAQALIEKGREFTITDNGVTYQPPQIAELLNNQYGQQLADYKEKVKYIKANMKPAPQGLGTFRVTSVSPNFLRLRHLRERQLI
jgi:hypothetical protein